MRVFGKMSRKNIYYKELFLTLSRLFPVVQYRD